MSDERHTKTRDEYRRNLAVWLRQLSEAVQLGSVDPEKVAIAMFHTGDFTVRHAIREHDSDAAKELLDRSAEFFPIPRFACPTCGKPD